MTTSNIITTDSTDTILVQLLLIQPVLLIVLRLVLALQIVILLPTSYQYYY